VFCSKNILTKLAEYQQPTCLCVKMEFVVGTISLSCEVYSLSWSCFRSCGVTLYGKSCFVLHVHCCGCYMVSKDYSTYSKSTRLWLHPGP